MGLPRAHRLKHWRDFQAVYSHGRVYRSRSLTLRRLPAPKDETTPARIGIAVGRSVSKRAVVRNRLKRRLRAALRPLLPRLHPGDRLVFSLRPPAVECEYEHFLRELNQVLTQAEVLDGH